MFGSTATTVGEAKEQETHPNLDWTLDHSTIFVSIKIKHTKNNKIQTVHIDRLAPCLLPPSPSPVEEQPQEQDTLVKQTAEPERRSTRSRKPPPYLESYV